MPPMKAKRPCGAPGCVRYAEPGKSRCAEHEQERERVRQRDVDSRRDPALKRMYHTKRWQQLRDQQLLREPLCAICARAGRISIATDCDHIEPHRGDARLFYDPTNLQSLCHPCHSRKTVEEDGGFGLPRRDLDR